MCPREHFVHWLGLWLITLVCSRQGGGTKFDTGITVQPKKGKAVLWPATFEHDPFVSDDRTHHEALPVIKGTKYAANCWLHQYDYAGPHHAGCTT